jgi:hypothetical protein
MWVVSFTPRLLYPRYASDRRLGRLQSPVWTTWRKFLTLPGIELRPLGQPVRCQLLYRLSYPGSFIRTYTAIIVPLHSVWGFALPCRERTLNWPDQRNEAGNTKETCRKCEVTFNLYIHVVIVSVADGLATLWTMGRLSVTPVLWIWLAIQ